MLIVLAFPIFPAHLLDILFSQTGFLSLNIPDFWVITWDIASWFNHGICQRIICLQNLCTLTLMLIRLTFGLNGCQKVDINISRVGYEDHLVLRSKMWKMRLKKKNIIEILHLSFTIGTPAAAQLLNITGIRVSWNIYLTSMSAWSVSSCPPPPPLGPRSSPRWSQTKTFHLNAVHSRMLMSLVCLILIAPDFRLTVNTCLETTDEK